MYETDLIFQTITEKNKNYRHFEKSQLNLVFLKITRFYSVKDRDNYP